MPHAREAIRKAIISALTGLPTTGANVGGQTPRSDTATTDASLRVLVGLRPETTRSEEGDDELGPYHDRDLPVRIEGRVRGRTDLEDALDDICLEVEQALAASASVNAMVSSIDLQATWTELSGELEKLVGVVTMDWLVVYRVDYSAPTAPQP